ncbi:type II toxin-antitoxin system YafO family toxin [Salmonella enterica subsp. enterica serovar Rubislaw]|nr:type II toxin-antitoxin system YafO family toxin [Salmonella enterica subsp. enterica serovar Rubislaw]
MENRISIIVDAAAGPLENYFAKALANYKNRQTVSAYLGKLGGFERNQHANLSGIYKAHIRIPGEDEPWPKSVPIHRRVSDNFLVFAIHNTYPLNIQIIAIIKPNGHERIKRLLPAIIDITEKKFQMLNERQLNKLNHFK